MSETQDKPYTSVRKNKTVFSPVYFSFHIHNTSDTRNMKVSPSRQSSETPAGRTAI